MTQGLPSTRRMPASTHSTAGVSGIRLAPALASLILISPRRAVDVVPPERDDLVLAAPRQQQETNRRDPRGQQAALRLGLVQHPAELPVLLRRQEPLPPVPLVEPNRPAGIAPRRRHAPCLGEPEHLRQHLHGMVRLGGLVPHLEMQVRHMRTLHGGELKAAELGHDVAFHHAPERRDRVRPAVHLDMRRHAARRQVGHGGLRRRRRRERLLAALDAVDDGRRILACFVGRDIAVDAEGGALHAGRPAHLDHVGLAASAVHPDPEAGQVAVPEDRIATLRGERVHRPLRNPYRVPSGQAPIPPIFSRSPHTKTYRNRLTSNCLSV